jgi:pentatricopeptide repeat protein
MFSRRSLLFRINAFRVVTAQEPLCRVIPCGLRGTGIIGYWKPQGAIPDGSVRNSRRLFASHSKGMLQSKWIESTKSLLDRDQNPVGSFDSLKWHLAETMIVHWAEKEGVLGLRKCFDLLNRLVDEAAHNPDANFRLHIYLVHAILRSWNQLLRRSEVNLLPSKVLEMLDAFTSRAKCFEPNIATYTIILDGAARCGIPDERIVFTERLLLRLINESGSNPLVRPTIVSFSTVINAWAKSGSRTAAEKAEALLWRVYALHESGWPDMEPNTQIYTSAIHAWANAGDPERAETLLKKMYEEYMLHGNKSVKPNIWSFNSVIVAWRKSHSATAFESAESLLRLMIELHDEGDLDCRPDAVSFNCLLRTLSQRRGDPTAFYKGEALVMEMLQRASESRDKAGLPNLDTFTTLFRLMAVCKIPDHAAKSQFWLKTAKELGLSDERFLLDQYLTAYRQLDKRPATANTQEVAPLPLRNSTKTE